MKEKKEEWPFYPFGHKKGTIHLDGWIQIGDDPDNPIWVKNRFDIVEESRWEPKKKEFDEFKL